VHIRVEGVTCVLVGKESTRDGNAPRVGNEEVTLVLFGCVAVEFSPDDTSDGHVMLFPVVVCHTNFTQRYGLFCTLAASTSSVSECEDSGAVRTPEGPFRQEDGLVLANLVNKNIHALAIMKVIIRDKLQSAEVLRPVVYRHFGFPHVGTAATCLSRCAKDKSGKSQKVDRRPATNRIITQP